MAVIFIQSSFKRHVGCFGHTLPQRTLYYTKSTLSMYHSIQQKRQVGNLFDKAEDVVFNFLQEYLFRKNIEKIFIQLVKNISNIKEAWFLHKNKKIQNQDETKEELEKHLFKAFA